jgi:5-methyltetrahydropteroyltriglutamate--homocysteine methyltransferase
MMTMTSNLGFPRIGPKRELKKALESYWSATSNEAELQGAGQRLRVQGWQLQRTLGIDQIPSNDFSFYDQLLDTTAMVGAVPPRFAAVENEVSLETYFAMARGVTGPCGNVDAMEMTKWFDTNYHFIVPELACDQPFRLASQKPVREFCEAKELGILTRPVLVGPVSYLLLAKCTDRPFDRLMLLDRLLPVYEAVLQTLLSEGAEWVQIDEPSLVLDLNDQERQAFSRAYSRLAAAVPTLSILVATYFGALDDNLQTACSLPVAGLHVDLVQGAGQLDAVLDAVSPQMQLSLGVIDGRNVWRADLDAAIELADQAVSRIGKDRVTIAPTCSLLHSPIDLDQETQLDSEIRQWLAFGVQKLNEISWVRRAITRGTGAIAAELQSSREALASRRCSSRVHSQAVQTRMEGITQDRVRRQSPYFQRQSVQRQRLKLPVLPTTTIGSFPQTKGVRAARSDFKAGRVSQAEYEAFLRTQVADTIRFQEDVGLDVLVHGEAERNDMVEYFGEQLSGFLFTKHGWVQSYGSRCVKPPIIFGDVSRPVPMTIRWIQYAQSLTSKPVKGM